jgi:DNA-binding transcriptional MerR regulator
VNKDMLKVGELAALANLTVRTLHHYDSIGLLRPSARSDAGYRLYNRDDVARLHRIGALRALGMSLSDIGLALDTPEGSPLAIVERQLAALDERIAQTTRTRAELARLRDELAAGGTPAMSMWLSTLEMTMERTRMYEKYLTPDELARLPMYHDDEVRQEWQLLVEQAAGLIRSQVPPEAEAARAFAQRWMQAFERGTASDPGLMAKLNKMAAQEGAAFGLDDDVMAYVLKAIGEVKFEVWARHLRPEVIERMRDHHVRRGREWPGLIAQVHAQAALDPDATTERARELARAWQELAADMIGTEEADVMAFRRATASEPLLRMGSGISEPALAWLRRAMAPA